MPKTVSDLRVRLNYEEIKQHTQKITNIKSSIDKYDWKGINYPSEKDDWKKIEKNNLTIAFNPYLVKGTQTSQNSVNFLCYYTRGVNILNMI